MNNRRIPKSQLISYGYNHQFVDHSVEFVSQEFNHIHTNTIERLWMSIKCDLRSKKITVGCLKAIAPFDFHKNLTQTQQIKFIRDFNIHNNVIVAFILFWVI